MRAFSLKNVSIFLQDNKAGAQEDARSAEKYVLIPQNLEDSLMKYCYNKIFSQELSGRLEEVFTT